MPHSDSTYIGQIASVSGAKLTVRLRDDMPSTLVLVDGESYRVGQLGAFFRTPLGYTNLFGLCTQVGANAAPGADRPNDRATDWDNIAVQGIAGFRWMTVVLFGESIGERFERGISQFPTIGDEVHLCTGRDVERIYRFSGAAGESVSIGAIAASPHIPAEFNLDSLVTRHCAVVGSTGAGKSNLVTVLLQALASARFPAARVLVIDPHGEYGSALGAKARVFKVDGNQGGDERPLQVPFWSLPFDEFSELAFGGLQPNVEASIRDVVFEMKQSAITHLKVKMPTEALTADSPVPYSVKHLWFGLDDFERKTFTTSQGQNDQNQNAPLVQGSPEQLISRQYPPASPYNQPPYKNQRKRNIERQLDFLKSRLLDQRFKFLFSPSGGFEPDIQGKVDHDLDELIADWIGGDRPISVFDVSGLPSEVLAISVGAMLRLIFDCLYWGQRVPVGGKMQPLLVVIDEAHRFLPEGVDTMANRVIARMAKEGRKYGVGLMLVTQRPSEIDSAVLSQCGSMIALRLTNPADRAKVSAAVPDDLGGLTDVLPALRTGEALMLGEFVSVPSRARIAKAGVSPVGDDPRVAAAWAGARPETSHYSTVLKCWRTQRTDLSEEVDPDNLAGG